MHWRRGASWYRSGADMRGAITPLTDLPPHPPLPLHPVQRLLLAVKMLDVSLFKTVCTLTGIYGLDIHRPYGPDK